MSSIYRQGLSDGQRKVVTDSANVSNSPSQVSNESGGNNSIADQLKAALGGNEGVTFKFQTRVGTPARQGSITPYLTD